MRSGVPSSRCVRVGVAKGKAGDCTCNVQRAAKRHNMHCIHIEFVNTTLLNSRLCDLLKAFPKLDSEVVNADVAHVVEIHDPATLKSGNRMLFSCRPAGVSEAPRFVTVSWNAIKSAAFTSCESGICRFRAQFHRPEVCWRYLPMQTCVVAQPKSNAAL